MPIRKTFLKQVLPVLTILLLAACARSEPAPQNTTPPPVTENTSAQATQTPPPTSTPEPISQGLIQVPVPDTAHQTAADLWAADRPPHDYYRAAVQFLGIPVADLTPMPPTAAPQVNDRANFYYNANLGGEFRIVPARLRHISENAAWWTGVNSTVADDEILGAAANFEEIVFPTNRLLFGRDWSPGIDNDHLIHFLVLQEESWGGFFGYFARANEFPVAIEPFSNEREMLVLNANAFPLDSDSFAGKLAHEYQHLIQWYQDPNEDLWLNEAFSELAYFLTEWRQRHGYNPRR